MEKRLYNFSAGPAVLPVPVLERIRDEMLCLPGCGASVMEISHRSKQFIAIQDAAKERLTRLLNIPAEYDVLFLQGGSRLQFSMIPMNLLRGQIGPAQYVLTGSWGKYALAEAKKEGATEVLYDAAATNYDRLPNDGELKISPDAAYVHITSNETIQGVQFPNDLTSPAPLVCDSSSDFLYRPVDIQKYGLMYACAQKNAGPAGVTVVVIRRDLLARSSDQLPGYLNYNNHSKEGSMWNTPPTFAVYVLGLVAEWVESTIGGLDAMYAHNQKKAKLVYDALDASPSIYLGHARKEDRSLMNVTFRFPTEELEKAFLDGAKAHRLDSLKGHRSVGGIRASIYNAMPMEGAQTLADYMRDFASKHA
ncbi:3-phosphoserine/phosphohydroxythreonine transaminase [Pirellula sp. SH-Sr6A]|uniref:3-phosphoserine/phosphohydroxythreonine transaminase n=1 Tax=Pirellula sp. SH-Sr6A TaxID=1632865 RepID=UPI0011BA5A0A|nr:3-phosphoserine/phosphohydroxythreonine transaminase [Pirellula sp. SH-Sr6A]